jgi:uncharacterized membrane protein
MTGHDALNVFQRVFASVDKRTSRIVDAGRHQSPKQPLPAQSTVAPDVPTCTAAKKHRHRPKRTGISRLTQPDVTPDPPIRQAAADDEEKPNSDVDQVVALIEELEAMLRDKAKTAGWRSRPLR